MSKDFKGTELEVLAEEYRQGSNVYIRAKTVDFYEAFNKANLETLKPVRYIHIYCDELCFSGPIEGGIGVINIPPTSYLVYIRVFARSIFSKGNLKTLRILNGTRVLKVYLYFDLCDTDLTILGQGSRPARVSKEPVNEFHRNLHDAKQAESGMAAESSALDCAGRKFIISAAGVETFPIVNVPATELDPLNAADIDGKARIRKNQNLLHLLNQMFASASRNLLASSKFEQECISVFRFITFCARNSATQASLYLDAQTMLARLELPRLYPSTLKANEASSTFYVPVLDFKKYKDTLSENIGIARNVEGIVTTTALFALVDGKLSKNAADLMRELGKNELGFIDTKANEEAALYAVMDAEVKRKDLEASGSSSQTALELFQKGMIKYEKEKQKGLIIDCIMAAGEVTVSVVVAVATCGAGAPLTVLTLKNALDNINSVVTLWEKVKIVLQKLGTVLGKIIPKLINSFDTYAATLALGRKETKVEATKGRVTAASVTIPPTTTTPIDYLGIMADWEDFKLDVDEMFTELRNALKGDTIDGMEAYCSTLLKTAVHGETLLAARRVVQESSSIYYRGLAESAARRQRCDDVQAISNDISSAPIIGTVLQKQLQQDLVNIRRGIYVMFHKCLLSLAYLSTATRYADIRISSDMGILQYDDQLNNLDRFWDNAEEKLINVTKLGESVIVDTEAHLGTVFNKDWKATLLGEKKVKFNIPWDLETMKGISRVRVKDVIVTFQGLKPPTNYKRSAIPSGKKSDNVPSFKYTVEMGPQIIDKDKNGRPIQYYIPPFSLHKAGSRGGWDDALGKFVRPALFCHGQILVSENNVEGWTLDEVIGVRMDWTVQGMEPSRGNWTL